MADTPFEQRLKELAGTTLPKGNYVLLELIASSPMSVVYKARDNASNRTVAVKILGDERYLWRFKAEAELGYLLNMANVANTIRADLTGETLADGMTIKYLVMKWISGLSLSEVIRNNRNTPMPTPQLLQFTVNLLKKITPALERIHAANIVHRDIKPNNIRFNSDALDKEEPYLLDFGIAKWVKEETPNPSPVDNAEKTKVWEAPGTHKYMPPEQWDGEAIARSDEYALALLVYEVLSDGYSPYEKEISAAPSTGGSTGGDALKRFIWEHAHRDMQPLPIQEYRLDVPQSVWQVILRALNKNPVMRYENIAKFTEAFIKAVQEPAAPVAPAPQIQRTIRQDREDLLQQAAAAAPKPEVPTPPKPEPEPTGTLNRPGTTLKMEPLSVQLKTRPTEDILKEAATGRAEGAQAIPPFKRAEMAGTPDKPARSILPFAIGGVVVLLIIGALIVLPSMNKPTEATLTPTDLFAVMAITQTADAAATHSPADALAALAATETALIASGTPGAIESRSAVEIFLQQTAIHSTESALISTLTGEPATSTAVPATDTVEPSATPTEKPTDKPTDTEVPPTATPIPPTATAVEVLVSASDTPTNVPPTTTFTATKTVTPSSTPTVAATKTPVPTATKTSTPTPRPSNTPTKTATPTATKTPTPTATTTYTPSPTATATITPSPTPSPTPTIPPLDVLDLLTQMRDAGRRANQFDCVNYIKAYDGLALVVTAEPDDAKVAVVTPLLAHANDPVTTLYTFCKLPANVDQSRVLLRSNLANNQYRVWGSLISQAISDVTAIQ